MNNINNFLLFSFMLFLSLLVSSCGDNTVSSPRVTAATIPTPIETSTSNTRGNQQFVAIKAYHYKTLAAFKKGQTETISLDNLAALAGKQINLVVLYEAIAPWAEVFNNGGYDATGSDYLNGLMETYDLHIIKQFAIDSENEGLVLEPNSPLSNPVEIAKELSMIDHVLMVEIKEVPQEELNQSTANVK